jgi:cytochrome c oxidase subunit 2
MPVPAASAWPAFVGHSAEARAMADLLVQTLVVCGVILAVVVGLVATCIVRFRARAGAPEPAQIHGHTRLELVWTLIPVAIVVLLFVLTARTMGATDPPPPARAPDLTVIGHQWWWEVRYPSGVVTANEIHIPVGQELFVELQSADVIHDFWVPALARKIDANPGRPNHFWISADQAGVYDGTCAEYCGAQHAWMRIRVIADAPADFAAWQRRELQPAAPPAAGGSAARGQALFTALTCVRCHAVAGVTPDVRVAPDLTHLAARQTLAAGLLENNATTLAAWLHDPQGWKPGSHMPDLRLSADQVADLVAYFETLR